MAKRNQKASESARWRFVALDSEGGSEGMPDADGFQRHKSFLWGASDVNGPATWLYDERPLKTKMILNWLETVAREYPRSIFISFAFNYDVAQILADLPYEKAWEVQHSKPYEAKDDKEIRPNGRRIMLYDQWGIQHLKGKSFALYRVGGLPKPRCVMRIFDVFGFFQSSFLRAIKTMPGVCNEIEYAIIEKGKKERGLFDHSRLNEMQRYTQHELIVLCRMMDTLRNAMLGQDINLTAWYGAGSIAQALMKRENVKPHLGGARGEDIGGPQEFAHHAFFGGRIELMQQGVSKERLYGYDIASAYPSAAADLPSMDGGKWEYHRSVSDLTGVSALSMVRLRGAFFHGEPFYPLPYRTARGAILFPREVYGIYMRDEALAAMDFIRERGGNLDIEGIWEFIPADPDARPFAFLRDMFAFRASLPKTDITQIVIKLGINSVYGKLAQSVGQYGVAPSLASPWHAAAITAWTRSRLLMASVRRPEKIVMFATDGIVATGPLALQIPGTKTLGQWESAELDEGVFIQSGVYALREGDNWMCKSRGFRPTNIEGSLGEFLRNEIPEMWRKGVSKFEFPYQNYMTLGAAVASPDTWSLCGFWRHGTRDLDLETGGAKRVLTALSGDRRARASRLIATEPARPILECGDDWLPMSKPSSPKWLVASFLEEDMLEREQENALAGFDLE